MFKFIGILFSVTYIIISSLNQIENILLIWNNDNTDVATPS